MHAEPQGLEPEQASEGQGERGGLGRANLGLVSEEGTVLGLVQDSPGIDNPLALSMKEQAWSFVSK